ncbi:restriction endonuclease subunit S [Pseudostreptobacillus hongkongensis]
MIKYLEKLLNGREVEWKKLGDVVNIQTGKLNSNMKVENGKYPFFTCDEISYKINNFAFDGEAILISGNGSKLGHINYYIGKFNAYQRTYVLMNNIKNVNMKYLMYFLKNSFKDYILNKSLKASIPYITLPIISNFEIPIPPLDIQEEIVRVLDKFTEHTKELTKELTLRKKEYNYYRDYLLEFNNIDKLGVEVKKVELLDVCLYSNEKIESSLLNLYNYISIENMLQNCKGVIPSSNVPDKGKWTKYAEGDILIGNIRPYLKKIWLADKEGGTNGDVLVLKKNSDKINMKYLYFVLSDDNFFNYVKNNIKSGKMPRGDKERILKYNFFLPTLEIQERIVNVLDNFEKICNDLNIGLPKEIELRQKEYEYYREYILTNIGNRITLEDKTI